MILLLLLSAPGKNAVGKHLMQQQEHLEHEMSYHAYSRDGRALLRSEKRPEAPRRIVAHGTLHGPWGCGRHRRCDNEFLCRVPPRDPYALDTVTTTLYCTQTVYYTVW